MYRDGDLSQELLVYLDQGGQTPGQQYTLSVPGFGEVAPGTPFPIPAGSDSVTMTLTAIDDTTPEPTQDVTIQVLQPPDQSYSVGAPSSVLLYILDNDGPPNEPPAANPDSYSVVHDGALETNLLANDTDPDADQLQVVFLSEPTHGTLTFQAANPFASGVFVYRPNPRYVGTDSLTYKFTDGTYESDSATVSIAVTNAAPAGGPDSFTGTAEDEAISGNVRDNDSDADTDDFQSFVATTTSHGELVLLDNGSFTYTPDVNYFGPDSFSYTLTDGLATSGPITVSLTVPSGGPFDLDGHDRATQTTWMSEPDEDEYGLGVSTSDSATIFARVYNVPPDMVIEQRRITFDPYVLAVDGVTQPGYVELSPGGGNEVLTVTALLGGYGSSAINYEILGHYNTGLAFATIETEQVVEQKAVLRQLEFTSDHNVIRENTVGPSTSGDRYKDVEFVRATKYNAPMTQTKSYDGIPSKMKVNVAVDWAGIPANTPIKIVGTSTETALQFESTLKSTGDLPGAGTVEITATNDVGKKIRTISGTIEWKMIVNPGAANEKTLPMGTSGKHKIYVLFDKPGNQEYDAFQVTDQRMDRTVAIASQALEDAQAAAPAGTITPTWQRIAYHVVKLQKFNPDPEKNQVQWPLNNDRVSRGWRVYNTWTDNPPGSDCISGAVFSWLVVEASGMPGTSSVDALVAKSETEPTKAVSWDKDDPNRHRNGGTERLGLLDRTAGGGNYNNFEATLIYIPPPVATASIFYFPVGAGDARFNNKDDVLTVMKRAVWVRVSTYAVVENVPPDYTQAANVSID